MPVEKPTPPTEPIDAQAPTKPTEAVPALRDKRVLPEGVVPKQAQAYVIAALSVMILMAVLFSKNHARTATPATPPPNTSVSNDANATRIEELEQNLTAEQRETERQQAQRRSGNPANAGTTSPNSSTQAGATAPATQSPAPAPEPRSDPIADAERELAFKSRFASNLISSENTQHSSTTTPENATTHPDQNGEPARPHSVQQQSPSPGSENNANKRPPEVNVNSAHGQPYVLFEGTTIDTALVNRLDGEFSGPVKVLVTNPVYSQDRQHVLIPEGTFLLGNTQKVGGLGQKRLAVTFHRMLMPDGYSVDLDQFHGLDQIGDTGLKDKVNNHYLEIFGTSIALGVIAGAAQSTTNNGYNQTGSEAYRQGIASSLSQSSANVLDRFINIPPTITIREGHRVKVYLTQDLLLPAYENHDMPGVM
jgi:type IV secretion system protein TrbI